MFKTDQHFIVICIIQYCRIAKEHKPCSVLDSRHPIFFFNDV